MSLREILNVCLMGLIILLMLKAFKCDLQPLHSLTFQFLKKKVRYFGRCLAQTCSLGYKAFACLISCGKKLRMLTIWGCEVIKNRLFTSSKLSPLRTSVMSCAPVTIPCGTQIPLSPSVYLVRSVPDGVFLIYFPMHKN